MLTAPEWEALRLSALAGAAATLCVLPPAIACGWWLARANFRGKTAVETLLLLPLVLPPVVTGYLLLLLLGRNGPLGALLHSVGVRVTFTFAACVVASAAMAFPLAYRACRTAFEGVDPRLVGLARTLGASPWDAFATVALPLARTGVLAAAVLAFARSVSEFGATIVLAGNVAGETRTLPLAVYGAIQAEGPAAAWRLAALSVLLAAAALAGSEALARRARR